MLNKNEKKEKTHPLPLHFRTLRVFKSACTMIKRILSMVKMVTFAISNNSDGTSGENSDFKNGIDEAKCGAITKMVTLITYRVSQKKVHNRIF